MFTMIQDTTTDTRAIVQLSEGAYVAPAGYVVGCYTPAFTGLSRGDALRVLAALFQKGQPVSLWWTGAADEIAKLINVPEWHTAGSRIVGGHCGWSDELPDGDIEVDMFFEHCPETGQLIEYRVFRYI